MRKIIAAAVLAASLAAPAQAMDSDAAIQSIRVIALARAACDGLIDDGLYLEAIEVFARIRGVSETNATWTLNREGKAEAAAMTNPDKWSFCDATRRDLRNR